MASDFESVFANISFDQLEQKSPRLMSFLIGFKAVDVNDAESRGVGVYIFQIGKEVVMAPAFFINGQVKPFEMLYLKNKDRFVPFTPEYVEHIIRQSPDDLGQVSTPGEDQLQTSVDLRNFVLPPRTGRFVTANWSGHLPDFLEASPASIKNTFASWLQKDAALLETVDKYYTWPVIKAALNKVTLVKKASVKNAVTFYTKDSSPEELRSLASESLIKLAEAGMWVEDRRESKSTTYNTQYLENWHNPTSPGIFRVVNSAGKVVLALVDPTPVNLASGSSAGVRRSRASSSSW